MQIQLEHNIPKKYLHNKFILAKKTGNLEMYFKLCIKSESAACICRFVKINENYDFSANQFF